MKRLTIIILSLAFVAVFAVSAFVVSSRIRSKRLSAAFAKVEVGDTNKTVVQLFGNPPDEVSNCYYPSSIDERNKKCVETYWYFSFLERWEIDFDRDGKVVDKGHNVSF